MSKFRLSVKQSPLNRRKGAHSNDKRSKQGILDSPSHRSTFLHDCRVSKRICNKVLEDVRDGSLVYIDLNTKTNFRKSKLPPLHTMSMILDSKDVEQQQPEDPICRLTTQLSRDIERIQIKKEHLRALFAGEKPTSRSGSMNSQRSSRPKLKALQPNIGELKNMSKFKQKLYLRQQQILKKSAPLNFLTNQLLKKFREILESMKD